MKDGYDNKNLSNYRNIMVIFNNFSKLLLKVSEETKKTFLDMLEKGKELQTFEFVIVDLVDNLKKLEYDKWYKTVVDSSYGIWVGGMMEDANPLLYALLVDGIIGGVGAVVGFLPLVMVMYFLIALLEDCGYMSRATVVLDPITAPTPPIIPSTSNA